MAPSNPLIQSPPLSWKLPKYRNHVLINSPSPCPPSMHMADAKQMLFESTWSSHRPCQILALSVFCGDDEDPKEAQVRQGYCLRSCRL